MKPSDLLGIFLWLLWFVPVIAAGVRWPRTSAAFVRRYRLVHPDAPVLPGERGDGWPGNPAWRSSTALTPAGWALYSTPQQDQELERLRRRAFGIIVFMAVWIFVGALPLSIGGLFFT